MKIRTSRRRNVIKIDRKSDVSCHKKSVKIGIQDDTLNVSKNLVTH